MEAIRCSSHKKFHQYIKQNNLNAKEYELEISTGSSDVPQNMQRISSIVEEIKRQGFEVKEVEVESDKEE
jgi:type I restriction-modification system DNA methylase subunit